MHTDVNAPCGTGNPIIAVVELLTSRLATELAGVALRSAGHRIVGSRLEMHGFMSSEGGAPVDLNSRGSIQRLAFCSQRPERKPHCGNPPARH